MLNKVSYDRLVEIHRTYNAATREVGAELGVPVIDMQALYGNDKSLFIPTDAIHPTALGHLRAMPVWLREKLWIESRIRESLKAVDIPALVGAALLRVHRLPGVQSEDHLVLGPFLLPKGEQPSWGESDEWRQSLQID